MSDKIFFDDPMKALAAKYDAAVMEKGGASIFSAKTGGVIVNLSAHKYCPDCGYEHRRWGHGAECVGTFKKERNNMAKHGGWKWQSVTIADGEIRIEGWRLLSRPETSPGGTPFDWLLTHDKPSNLWACMLVVGGQWLAVAAYQTETQGKLRFARALELMQHQPVQFESPSNVLAFNDGVKPE